MQHCVHRVTNTAISTWRPAISVNFSTSQYGAYAASFLLLYIRPCTQPSIYIPFDPLSTDGYSSESSC